MNRIRLTAITGLALALASTAGAQGAEPYTFRMLLGRDTLSSEVVQRTPVRLDVSLIDKTASAHWQYGLTLTPDGRVTRMHNAFYRLAQRDTTPFQTAELVFTGDSVTATIAGNVSRVEHLATNPGAIPYINPSFAMIEQIVRRAWAMGHPVDTVPVFLVSGGRTIPATVTRVGRDSAVVALGAAIHVAVGPDGALLGALIPAQRVRVIRLAGAHPLVTEKIEH